MSAETLLQVGSCRCNEVRFSLSEPPVITMACHCTGCQKMTSSAFSLSALYAAGAFTVTQGCPVIGGLHGVDRHYFCPRCMSWLFTRPHGIDEFVNVRASLLDNFQGVQAVHGNLDLRKAALGKYSSGRKFRETARTPRLPTLDASLCRVR